MLDELHIAGLGVIEDAWLSLHPGLNVLSGETGAGKTMVTVALGLALGARASSALVRPGAARLGVEVRFAAVRGDPATAEWVDQDDGAAAEELILARTVGADGRSSSRIGGRMAPVAALHGVGAGLVEIHGQNQAERLASLAAQTEFLDRFAGPDHTSEVAEYRAAHGSVNRIQAAIGRLEEGAREREREKDLLAYQVREIEAAGIAPGELAALAESEGKLAHAERILDLATVASGPLTEDDGAADRLRAAAEAFRAIASLDPGGRSPAERLADLAAEASDVADEVRRYAEGVELDPARLAQVRERLQAIRSLERKYGEGEDGILEFLAQAGTRLEELQDDQGSREAFEAELAVLKDRRAALAARLTARRARVAPTLADLLTTQVRELGMPGAEVGIELQALDELGPDGAERVELTFSGGLNQPVLPLAKVASGGELSRTMLACRSVLADLDDVPTLVFDEVDAGIGGRAAAAVADRLASLAGHRQIIVVSHLAQIAARADRHFVVTKEGGTATVRTVEGEERVAEVARMLSGSTAQVSLAHARELLAEAAERAVGGSPDDAGPDGRSRRRTAVGASGGSRD